MRKIKILYLYSEPAEYFVACLRHLEKNYHVDIHVVKWPVHIDAPFRFNFPEGATVYNREDFNDKDLMDLAKSIHPDLIYCCGWMDKGYIQVCKHFRPGIPVLGGMDNQWTGSMKQQIARLVSPLTIKRYFTHMFVAGKPQREYAQKLGFSDDQIFEGYYSSDTKLFHGIYEKARDKKKKHFPLRFLYVGRYTKQKGLLDLWDAFVELQDELETSWELWCCGTGELEADKPVRSDITHFGFLQPEELAEVAEEAGVFVLPSYSEPWGVVVHEFASAGFPMICSDKVGAATKFLENEKNGFVFEAGNPDRLKYVIKKMMQLKEDVLFEMAEKSATLAKKITPETWSRTQLRLIEQQNRS